jgi:hypothetical protein
VAVQNVGGLDLTRYRIDLVDAPTAKTNQGEKFQFLVNPHLQTGSACARLRATRPLTADR